MKKPFWAGSLELTLTVIRLFATAIYIPLLYPWILFLCETTAMTVERISGVGFMTILSALISDWMVLRENILIRKYLEYLLLRRGGARDSVVKLLEQEAGLSSWVTEPSFQIVKSSDFTAYNIHNWCQRALTNLSSEKSELQKSRAAIFLLETLCNIVLDRYYSRRQRKKYISCLAAIERAVRIEDLPTAILTRSPPQ